MRAVQVIKPPCPVRGASHRGVRLRLVVLHIHEELKHRERHRVGVAVLRLLVGGARHELAKDAHVRGVGEDVLDGDVGQVLPGDLVPVLAHQVRERAQPARLVAGEEGKEAAGQRRVGLE